MNAATLPAWTAFDGHRRIASGLAPEVAVAVKRAVERDATAQVLAFDDTSGTIVDVDTRGTEDEVRARVAAVHAPAVPEAPPADAPRRRGRPRLGVVAREVTLLPRHWEWLNAQPGGASVALRRLVEAARRTTESDDGHRRAREAAYRVMHALGGDLPGFEEASRALFAGDEAGFRHQVAKWPRDVQDHLIALAFGRPEAAG